MRILHLIYSLNVGGAERMVITLANYQVQSNQVGSVSYTHLTLPTRSAV